MNSMSRNISPTMPRGEQESMTNVVIIGSGNVATCYALALKHMCHIKQIYSRNLSNAQALAQQLHCDATSDLKHLAHDADIYIIAVSDDAIASIATSVPDNGALWLHTSGSTPLQVLSCCRKRCGVMWPMQSLSKSHPTLLCQAHLFIEGSDASTCNDVHSLASIITSNVHQVSSHDRMLLHVASVFASNFANHMFTLAGEVLNEAEIPFDALLPLIKTTIAKLDHMLPSQSQTGPAARHDINIMNKHLDMLTGIKHDIYKLISHSIENSHP